MEWFEELKWMLNDSDPHSDTYSTIQLRWNEMKRENLSEAQTALINLARYSNAGLVNAMRVLRDLSRKDADFGVDIVVETLKDCNDGESLEMALQCFECWDDPSFIPFLETLELDQKWLNEYRDSIVKWLGECKEKCNSELQWTEHCQSIKKEGKMNENLSDDVFVLDVLCDENGFAAVPFDLSGQPDAVVYVDWHDDADGNLEELNEQSSILGSTHRYAESKTMHRIEIFSPDWSKVCICGVSGLYSNPSNFYSPMSFAGVMSRCKWHLKSPIPPLKGVSVMKVDDENWKDTGFQWRPEIRVGSMDCAMTLFWNIEEIDEGIFSKNIASSFEETFKYCRFGCPIPKGLFKGQSKAESFASCFDNCEFADSGSTFPEWLFQDCVNAKRFSRIFSSSNLSVIPEGMFYGCEAAEDYTGAFAKTQIETLPQTRLFSPSPRARKFNACFYSCEKLKELPDGLFSGTSAETFTMCFSGCTALEDVKDVFAGCTEAENFSCCFSECSRMRFMPVNIFWSSRKAKTFHRCFEGCSSLTAIGHDFFKDLTEVEDFSFCFKGCTCIARIPDKLFCGCVKAESFAGTFEDCRSIEILPNALFKDCVSAVNFKRTFAKCSSIHTVDVNLFSWAVNAVNFCQCFNGCASFKDADLRIDSRNVENAKDFYPSRINSQSGNSMSVYVPFETETYTSFRNAEALSFGWHVESYFD